MLAAFLEWFLWIAAFLYCLWKVFVKAEHWTIRVLSVVVAFFFTALRYVADSSVVFVSFSTSFCTGVKVTHCP